MSKRRFRPLAVVPALLLVLAACGTGDGDTTESGESPAEGGNGNKSEEVVIGGIAGWWEGVAVGQLYKHVLEENGYTNVTFKTLDAAPTYQGVADGTVDLFFDAWLPTTHEDYWDRFQDQVVDVGVWYEEAPLTITVPSYMEDVNSIEDLPEIGDQVDWTITGIDSGAGLYRLTKNEVMPQYNLDQYEMPSSSGTAMVASLGEAIENEEPIVVTLWHPHFAYGQWDLKDLEDPKNALGDPDSIHVIGSQEAQEETPVVLENLEDWTMSDEKLSDLGAFLEQEEYENDVAAGVQAWAEENPDVVESMSQELSG